MFIKNIHPIILHCNLALKILQIFQNCDANVYVKLYYKYFLVMLDTVTAEDNMTPAFSYRT